MDFFPRQEKHSGRSVADFAGADWTTELWACAVDARISADIRQVEGRLWRQINIAALASGEDSATKSELMLQNNNTTPVWISSPTTNVKTSINKQCRRQE